MTTTVAQPTNPAAASPTHWVKTWWPILLFSLLWVDLVRLLSGNWEAREQYAYGWFVPFLALALLWRRWMDRPAIGPMVDNRLVTGFVALAALVLLPLRIAFEINTDWPLIAWVYTLIAVGLTLYAFHLAGGQRWVRHFAFPICFILVALVWPYRIEKGLTQNLMQVVASLTVEIIGWFGVPALQRGNLIEVSTGVVGVDEACSGIRSFQSTLMAALFLGELYRLSWRRRLSLLVGGVIMSFAFNVVRTLFLTYQASAHGVSAIDKWHDSAGMSIFLISFACLWGIAVLIQRKSSRSGPQTTDNGTKGRQDDGPQDHLSAVGSQSAVVSRPRAFMLAVGLWAVLCVGATEAWYRSHQVKNPGVFHWTANFPVGSETYKPIELPERTRKLIASDSGGGWTWSDGQDDHWTAYFFRWNPTSIASVLRARIHRPERCLPASGLRLVADGGLVTVAAAGFQLPFRAYTYEAEGKTLHVFFCQWEDGRERQSGMAGSNQEGRLQSVLVGRRSLGQQTLEFIVTGPTSLEEAARQLASQLPALIRAEPPTRVAAGN